MSGFIRPEARAALWRWREVISGALLVFLGSYWFFGAGGLLTIVGAAAGLTGAALVFLGLQRGRFRGKQGGIGSVDIDEGQVTYFGPMTGGAVALRDMTELALLRTGVTLHWRLSTQETQLFIPADAYGSDALFDAFTALPGLRTEKMLAVLSNDEAHDTVIWRRSSARDAPLSLH